MIVKRLFDVFLPNGTLHPSPNLTICWSGFHVWFPMPQALGAAKCPAGHSSIAWTQWCLSQADLMLWSHVDHWRLAIYLSNVGVLCISLPDDFRLIFIKQMVHNIAMPFYSTSKLVSKTSRDDAPCPPRGLFDAPSRSCWQLEPLKKERPSGHTIAGIPTVSVWPNPRRNACLMRFVRSMAVSIAFVLSSTWERHDNMYLRCQSVSTLHQWRVFENICDTYLLSICPNEYL